MKTMRFASAMSLSLLVAACGEKQDANLDKLQGSDAAPTTAQGAETYFAAGEVTAIAGDQVTISHGPVEGIGWPAMTMTFQAGSPGMIEGVSVGDRVSFAFRQEGGRSILTSIAKS